jgi:hypothetical protein
MPSRTRIDHFKAEQAPRVADRDLEYLGTQPAAAIQDAQDGVPILRTSSLQEADFQRKLLFLNDKSAYGVDRRTYETYKDAAQAAGEKFLKTLSAQIKNLGELNIEQLDQYLADFDARKARFRFIPGGELYQQAAEIVADRVDEIYTFIEKNRRAGTSLRALADQLEKKVSRFGDDTTGGRLYLANAQLLRDQADQVELAARARGTEVLPFPRDQERPYYSSRQEKEFRDALPPLETAVFPNVIAQNKATASAASERFLARLRVQAQKTDYLDDAQLRKYLERFSAALDKVD